MCSKELYIINGVKINGLSEAECIAKKIAALTEKPLSVSRFKDVIRLRELLQYVKILVKDIIYAKNEFNHTFGDTSELKRKKQLILDLISKIPSYKQTMQNLNTQKNSIDCIDVITNFIDIVSSNKYINCYWIPIEERKQINKPKPKEKTNEKKDYQLEL